MQLRSGTGASTISASSDMGSDVCILPSPLPVYVLRRTQVTNIVTVQPDITCVEYENRRYCCREVSNTAVQYLQHLHTSTGCFDPALFFSEVILICVAGVYAVLTPWGEAASPDQVRAFLLTAPSCWLRRGVVTDRIFPENILVVDGAVVCVAVTSVRLLTDAVVPKLFLFRFVGRTRTQIELYNMLVLYTVATLSVISSYGVLPDLESLFFPGPDLNLWQLDAAARGISGRVEFDYLMEMAFMVYGILVSSFELERAWRSI